MNIDWHFITTLSIKVMAKMYYWLTEKIGNPLVLDTLVWGNFVWYVFGHTTVNNCNFWNDTSNSLALRIELKRLKLL